MSMNKQPNSEMCFVCGRNNPVGLYLQFYDDGDNEVVSEYTVPERYQGYPGIVHGGVLAAMLDEVVGRVAMIGDPHHFMMSVKLAILYRHPVPVNTPLKVVGRIVRLRGMSCGRTGPGSAAHAVSASRTSEAYPPTGTA